MHTTSIMIVCKLNLGFVRVQRIQRVLNYRERTRLKWIFFSLMQQLIWLPQYNTEVIFFTIFLHNWNNKYSNDFHSTIWGSIYSGYVAYLEFLPIFSTIFWPNYIIINLFQIEKNLNHGKIYQILENKC